MNLPRLTILTGRVPTNNYVGNKIDKNGRCIHRTSETLKPMEKNEGEEVKPVESTILDDFIEPTNCCMSGCANCVWIQYAERLSNALEKSDVDLQKVIIERVQDPNMKAFLLMELRCRNLLK